MSKQYTTRTAALKATTIDSNIIDAKKLMIYPGAGSNKNERKNILELIKDNQINLYDARGIDTTSKDIWGRKIEKNGENSIIHCNWLNATIDDETKSSIHKVHYNKAVDANNNLILNIECDRIKSVSVPLFSQSLTYFDGDLNNLEIGTLMFENSSIKDIRTSLDSLVLGDSMFKNSLITHFNTNLPALSRATGMFKDTLKLNEFNGSLDTIFDASSMFEGSTLTSFSSHTPYLYKGTNMFANSNISSVLTSFNNLLEGVGMFENTNLDIASVKLIAETLPKINSFTYEEDGSKTFPWANGLTFKYLTPQWSNADDDTKLVESTFTISSKNIGEIMITWKDTSVLSKEEKAIIIYEYFKLMTLKGWTVVTNLYEDKTDEDGNTIVPSGVYYRIVDGHTYIATNIHYPENGFKDKSKWIHVDSIENIPANTIA
jgi:hypothetical protein